MKNDNKYNGDLKCKIIFQFSKNYNDNFNYFSVKKNTDNHAINENTI